MSRGSIILRVDGSSSDGMGRVARCLALANALQRRRYQMTFISKLDNNGWPDRIRRFRHFVAKTNHQSGSPEDLQSFLRDVRSQRPAVVITDSPDIGQDYLARLSNEVPLVISIDDRAELSFSNGLVLHPMLHDGSCAYDLAYGTQLLSGERYAMVRAEFRRARNVRATEPGGPARVLIALGGGEVVGQTAVLAGALLKNLKTLDKIDAVVGSSRSCEPLEELSAEFAGRVTITKDARDMGSRMSKAHLIVTGGGNTALEAACVGVPMILISRHAAHVRNALQLEEQGVAHYLGHFDKVKAGQVCKVAEEVLSDRFERRVMSRAGRMLIDGRGPDRLVTATEILLRRAKRSKAVAA